MDIYTLDGYGEILELNNYLNNADGVIELLEHSNSPEQFNYILRNSGPNAHNNKLLEYLKLKDYKIEDYMLNLEIIGNSDNALLRFKELIEYLISKSDEEDIKELLSDFKSANEEIADILAKRDDAVEIFKSNYCFKESPIVVKKILAYYQENSDLGIDAIDENIKELLKNVNCVDEEIADILAKRADALEIFKSNSRFKESTIVVEKLLAHYEENPREINFEFLKAFKPLTTYLDTELIRKMMDLGYVVDENSPNYIINNNEIMEEIFLNSLEIQNEDILSDMHKEMVDIPGSYGALYKSKSKIVFCDEFMSNFSEDEFKQIVKYIVLSDYDIDFSQIINSGKLELIKNMHDNLNSKETFDLELFVQIIYKYNLYSDIFEEIDESILEENKENFKIFFEHKGIKISSVDDIINIRQTIFNNFNERINSATDIIDYKNVICNLLTNQTYLETKKGLFESGNSEKLKVLKASMESPLSDEVDSYIILSQFLEKMDSLDDPEQLKEIATLLNNEMFQNGFNEDWIDLNSKIMSLYTRELNGKMTNFEDYITETIITEDGQEVKIARIEPGKEYNAFIHVLNAYDKGLISGTIEALANPRFFGASYICLSGISDEYSKIAAKPQNVNNVIKVLYSYIPDGNLFFASNKDVGIVACENSKNVKTLYHKNMIPFRRLVRSTEKHGHEEYNEYDVYREGVFPSGIAFTKEQPTEEEISAAAYLGVPLVYISGLGKDNRYLGTNNEHNEEESLEISYNNSEFDQMLFKITNKIDEIISNSEVQAIEVDANNIAKIGDANFTATPIYDDFESSDNIPTTDLERKFLEMKLCKLLEIEPRFKYYYCKYPDGKVSFSILENEDEDSQIYEYLEYLTDDNFSEKLENLEELETQNILQKLNSISDDKYLELFENLIASNNLMESKNFIKLILSKKEQIKELCEKEVTQKSVTNTSIESQEEIEPINEEDYENETQNRGRITTRRTSKASRSGNYCRY